MPAAADNNMIADWVFESVLQFLKSPMWTAPIDAFMDTHCDAFDITDTENKLEYTQLHNEFKEMVEDLLSTFLGELGVEPTQFVEACGDAPEEFQELSEMLTQYLVAMEDFRSFRAMMESRRSQVELEAIYEHSKYSLQAQGLEEEDMDEDEKFLLEMAIHASLGEEEVTMKQLAAEDAALLQQLAVRIALEQEKMLHAQLEAEDEEERQALEEEANAKVAAMEEASRQQRMENVEKAIATMHPSAKEKEQLEAKLAAVAKERRPLGASTTPLNANGVISSAAARTSCSVFGAKKSALPDLNTNNGTPSAQSTASTSVSQPTLSSLVAQSTQDKENVAVTQEKKIIGTAMDEPSKEELEQRKAYFQKLGEKIRSSKEESRKAEVNAFASTKGISGVDTVKTNSVASAKTTSSTLSEEEREMRVALARRFKEELLQSSK